MAWVFAAAYLPRLPGRKHANDPFLAWQPVALVAWTGMRGAVSLAAALGLPWVTNRGVTLPGRETIQFLTYCVILHVGNGTFREFSAFSRNCQGAVWSFTSRSRFSL